MDGNTAVMDNVGRVSGTWKKVKSDKKRETAYTHTGCVQPAMAADAPCPDPREKVRRL
jgi:hypothetical protein